jgi:hypothetical protein
VATVLNTQASLPLCDSLDGNNCPLPLVQIIELKWLLAGHGIDIHVERLQTDPAYARAKLTEASQVEHPALRAAAQRLLQRLPAAG